MIQILDYYAMVSEAFRVVVKEILRTIQRNNSTLPGDHHFYISFLTHFPGVVLSKKLLRKYPEEITIVLQYEFSDLQVTNESFNVILSFDEIKERITVPFASLTEFTDPSANFTIKFSSPGNHGADEFLDVN